MKPNSYVSATAITILLAGCGGGSAGFPEPPANGFPDSGSPGAVSQAPGGIWYGTLTFDASQVTEEFVAMTADDGRFRLVSVDSDVQMHGQAVVAMTSLTGSGRAFADNGVNWLDGSHVVDVTIAATIVEHDMWWGTWANATGESGSFEFFYDSLYENGADVARLEAVWTGYDDMSNPVVTFTIGENGSFAGQNATGCTSTGRFTAIDPAYNLYDVQSVVQNCALAGNYSGFAILADLVRPDDVLLVSIDNGTRAILLGLER